MSLQNNIPQIVRRIKANEKIALHAVGLFIASETKKLAPVDTGRLRSNYHHALGDHLVRVGTNVNYAHFVELGTRYQRPQPHLRTAFERNRKKILRLLQQEMLRGL